MLYQKTDFFEDVKTNIIEQEKRTIDSANLLDDFIQLKCSWYISDPMWDREYLKNKRLLSVELLIRTR